MLIFKRAAFGVKRKSFVASKQMNSRMDLAAEWALRENMRAAHKVMQILKYPKWKCGKRGRDMQYVRISVKCD